MHLFCHDTFANFKEKGAVLTSFSNPLWTDEQYRTTMVLVLAFWGGGRGTELKLNLNYQ